MPDKVLAWNPDGGEAPSPRAVIARKLARVSGSARPDPHSVQSRLRAEDFLGTAPRTVTDVHNLEIARIKNLTATRAGYATAEITCLMAVVLDIAA
jgi:hypothetical protein